MRRAAASILVTLGLVAAGVAWWAYAARYTVLDSDRSERIAETLIDQPVIQDSVAEGLGKALQQALPPGTPISPEEIDAVAHPALADPRAMAALKTAVLASHQRLVGNYDGPVTVDVSPIAVAGRDALRGRPTRSRPGASQGSARCRSTCRLRTCPSSAGSPSGPGSCSAWPLMLAFTALVPRHARRRPTGRRCSPGPDAGRSVPGSSGPSSAGPSPTP